MSGFHKHTLTFDSPKSISCFASYLESYLVGSGSSGKERLDHLGKGHSCPERAENMQSNKHSYDYRGRGGQLSYFASHDYSPYCSGVRLFGQAAAIYSAEHALLPDCHISIYIREIFIQ
jgi:hypothetical protein